MVMDHKWSVMKPYLDASTFQGSVLSDFGYHLGGLWSFKYQEVMWIHQGRAVAA